MNLARTALPLLLASLTSCLVSREEHEHHHGRYVDSAALAAIEPGCDEAFVLAMLGEPSARGPLDETGRSIWRWSWTKDAKEETAVLFLAARTRHEKSSGATYVEFRAGKVVRAWDQGERGRTPRRDS